MVSLLWAKRCSACLTASIRLTAGRAAPAPAAGGGGGEVVEAEPEDGAEAEAVAADFISALASRSTLTQKRMSSAGRRTGGSE
jgi:hypothetical protein